jgi:hypothetical protein
VPVSLDRDLKWWPEATEGGEHLVESVPVEGLHEPRIRARPMLEGRKDSS